MDFQPNINDDNDNIKYYKMNILYCNNNINDIR